MLGTPVDLAQGRPSTPTSSPGSPTTSARGRPATAAPSCSAATTPVRAVHQRPHRRAGQPAGQPEGQLPDRRRPGQPAGSAGVAGRGRDRARAPGGPTTSAGSPSAPGRRGPRPTRWAARGSPSSVATRRAPMSSTADVPRGRAPGAPPTRSASSPSASVAARCASRSATGPADGPPLLLCNGIGASLERAPAVRRRARPRRWRSSGSTCPGVGGSPPPLLPYHFAGLARLAAGMLAQLGHRRVRRPRLSWGGGARPAVRRSAPAARAAGWCWWPPAPAR